VFENLIESKPKAKKSVGQSILSLLVHGAVIFAAVKVTAGAAETIKGLHPISPRPMWSSPPTPRPRDFRRSWRRPTSPRTSRPST
jgi:hypothetical protein